MASWASLVKKNFEPHELLPQTGTTRLVKTKAQEAAEMERESMLLRLDTDPKDDSRIEVGRKAVRVNMNQLMSLFPEDLHTAEFLTFNDQVKWEHYDFFDVVQRCLARSTKHLLG